MKKKIITLFIALLSINSLFSQEESDMGKLTLSGYTDVNYFHNLNKPLSGNNTGVSGFARAFDQRSEQFQLGLVQTKISYAYKKSSLVADIAFGPHADLGNYGNLVGPLGTTSALAIKQAYLSFSATDKLTFTAGQFGTHIGYEVIDAPVNFNYSLSNLFNNGPFYHVGVKADYLVHEKFAVMLGLVNNWDNLYDNNHFKTVVSQFKFMPNSKSTFYVNYIGGNEVTRSSFNSVDSLNSFKQMLDLVVNYQMNDRFYFGVNATVGSFHQLGLGMQNWGGIALYSNCVFTSLFSMGFRAEYLDNTQGIQYIGNTQVQSYTLTGKFSLQNDHLVLKQELRFDQYGNKQFEDENGAFTRSSQLTIGAAAVYKF